MSFYITSSYKFFKPVVSNQGTFLLDSTVLADVIGKTIAPSDFLSTQLTAPKSTLIPWGSRSVLSYNFMAVLTSSNAAAEIVDFVLSPGYSEEDPFHLGVSPAIIVPAAPEVGGTWSTYPGPVVVKRTAPATTDEFTTLFSAGVNTLEGEIGGGGSFTTYLPASQLVLDSDFILFDIVNLGTTSTFTLESLAIWGTYRDISRRA